MKQLNDYQKNEIKEVLSDKLGIDLEDINDDSHLRNDLGTDSLDDIELIMEFEQKYNISIPYALAEEVEIVSDIYKCLEQCM